MIRGPNESILWWWFFLPTQSPPPPRQPNADGANWRAVGRRGWCHRHASAAVRLAPMSSCSLPPEPLGLLGRQRLPERHDHRIALQQEEQKKRLASAACCRCTPNPRVALEAETTVQERFPTGGPRSESGDQASTRKGNPRNASIMPLPERSDHIAHATIGL